jgi:hypothetical protein
MKLDVRKPVLVLEPGEVITLDDAEGTRIRARSGTVWVTEEGSSADNVVGPGEWYTVRRPGRTVVQALKTAWVSLTDCVRPANDPTWPGSVEAHEDAIAEMRHRIFTRYY